MAKNVKVIDPNVLTEQQRTMAIAAGMVGGVFDRENMVIVMERGVPRVHYTDAGEIVVDIAQVNQNDKWKEYYINKVRTAYTDKTAMVQRIIASKGRSL